MIHEAGFISHNAKELANNSGFHGDNAINMLNNWLRKNNCFIDVAYYRLREGSAKKD